MATAAKELATLASRPDATSAVFLLVQAGLVCQWVIDYEHYARGHLTVGDMCSLVAVQQLCMLLGPSMPILAQSVRLVKPLIVAALASSGLFCLAKIWGYYKTAAVVQGLLLSSVVACLNLDAQPAALNMWQNYACQIAWTAAAVAVDLFRLSFAAVYVMAASTYLQAAVLVARRLSPKDHLTLRRRAKFEWNLEDRLRCLVVHMEDTAHLTRAVSNVCLEAAAILARVAFPALVLDSCAYLLDSVGMLFVVRLCLERAASNQGRRASQTGFWRLTSRTLGYVMAIVGVAVFFGTPCTVLGVCGSHFLIAYAVTLAEASEPLVPAWQTTAGGLLSSAVLLWLCRDASSGFEAALGWASVLLCVGLLATLPGALAQVRVCLSRRLRALRNCLASRLRSHR